MPLGIKAYVDFAFKKIFGSIESKPILISFLNAVLYHKPVVDDLEILDPYLAPKLHGLKDTYVDVRALLNDGRHVIIDAKAKDEAGARGAVSEMCQKLLANPVTEDFEIAGVERT